MTRKLAPVIPLYEVPRDEDDRREMLAELRKVLKRAKAGEFRAVVLITVNHDGLNQWAQVGLVNGAETLGTIAMAYHNACHACAEVLCPDDVPPTA